MNRNKPTGKARNKARYGKRRTRHENLELIALVLGLALCIFLLVLVGRSS